MENYVDLEWKDKTIPHNIWVEQYAGYCKIFLKVVKDFEPEVLSTIVPDISLCAIVGAWEGEAENLTPSYDNDAFFMQMRRLFKFESGDVFWSVNHMTMANGSKRSIDRLIFIDKDSN